MEPEYQEHKSVDIPTFASEDGTLKAKIVAGEVLGVKSPVKTRTPTYFIDFTLQEGQSYEHIIPATWNSMIYNYQGTISLNDSSDLVVEDSCSVFTQDNDNAGTIKITS